ncbi:hypothetical protein GC089_06020 [Cellulomonas sp. JZ18]|uniref:hypothetical protein n=1 Tax=Cellulomonas sp. JZ18 TaxID=2654191 RepID=UPI0012D4074A|nr:hypothetical protein [Cellulomonas sp. JZ18]QGQ18879.1 hypothetical protein GC089_06020 [Cellulomonas sp. JZ18]
MVTSAQWQPGTAAVEVSAYVSVVEQGGECTLTLEGPGGASARTSQPALADASTTSCGLMSVARDRLAPGTWTGSVRYVSPTTSGEARLTPMEIP